MSSLSLSMLNAQGAQSFKSYLHTKMTCDAAVKLKAIIDSVVDDCVSHEDMDAKLIELVERVGDDYANEVLRQSLPDLSGWECLPEHLMPTRRVSDSGSATIG